MSLARPFTLTRNWFTSAAWFAAVDRHTTPVPQSTIYPESRGARPTESLTRSEFASLLSSPDCESAAKVVAKIHYGLGVLRHGVPTQGTSLPFLSPSMVLHFRVLHSHNLSTETITENTVRVKRFLTFFLRALTGEPKGLNPASVTGNPLQHRGSASVVRGVAAKHDAAFAELSRSGAVRSAQGGTVGEGGSVPPSQLASAGHAKTGHSAGRQLYPDKACEAGART